MASRSVFASWAGGLPLASARNCEGAPALPHDDAHALAQLAATGSFGALFYTDPDEELARTVDLAGRVEPLFLAQAAIHARARGHMKDMPAVLLAVLSGVDPALFRRAFGRVVDNGRMLRTFVQVMRSGRTGRRSLGSAPKAMVRDWLERASDRAILEAAIGNDPSLADVIRMVHPRPATAERRALYAWIVGRPCDVELLPAALRDWLRFRETGEGSLPDVPFQMLTQLPLRREHWAAIAEGASWQMLRQNLNAFLRHGVFEDPAAVERVASTLRDPERIRRARVLPYQLMVAGQSVAAEMPEAIREALDAALELSVSSLPAVAGSVVVCPDVSGSMRGPVTGFRKGATSTVRHVDVAALVAAAMLRANRAALVLPFEHRVVDVRLDPAASIRDNAARLAAVGGGGTDCSAPLAHLNARGLAPDLVVFVSDNQSWVDAARGAGSTATLAEWERLRRRNRRARLVCLDVAPYGTTQAGQRLDVLNLGGFSDAAFDRIASFARGDTPDLWVREIRGVEV